MDNIMIVDDEPGVLEIISEVLAESGIKSEKFLEAPQAVKALKKKRYDIVITDLKMPKINGLELAKIAKEECSDTEIIVVTGYASLESAIDALRQNVYNYVLKPFNVSEILSTIEKVSERIRLKKQNVELHKRVEKGLADLTTLHEISKIINYCEDVGQVLGFAADTIESSVEINVAALMLFDYENNEFFIRKGIGLTEKTIKNFKIKPNEGIIGQAIRPNEKVIVAGFEKDQSFVENIAEKDKKRINCFITIPLNAQDKLIGLIVINQLDSDDKDELDKLKLIEVMAVNIAPMILLGEYSTEHNMILKDSLWGAKNELLKIIKKAKDYRGTLSILILKLYLKKKHKDDFRLFDIGDLVYEHILKCISPIDSAVKIGLDSFMVILQGKTKILTEELAAKIKELVENDNKISNKGFLLDYGYADFPMDGQEFDVLISKAQSSLWEFVKMKSMSV
jgi:FixJ family two-component response regulator